MSHTVIQFLSGGGLIELINYRLESLIVRYFFKQQFHIVGEGFNAPSLIELINYRHELLMVR